MTRRVVELIHDANVARADIFELLQRFHDVHVARLDDVVRERALRPDVLAHVVDIDLGRATSVDAARRLVARSPVLPRAFVVGDLGRRTVAQAYAAGAHDLLVRPLDPAEAQRVLGILRIKPVEALWGQLNRMQQSALRVSLKVFEDVMSGVREGGAVDQRAVVENSTAIIQAMDQIDLTTWLDALRDHHNYTFRHVMFVTGTLVSFARLLGLNNEDMRRVAVAGLLHDVGKATVPLSILDKPARLDDAEWQVMRQHPLKGEEILARGGGRWPADVVDAVLHHHEKLDGSGYPHGLRGDQIGDMTRMVAIADFFSALIDKRAYKAAMDGAAALEIMRREGGKVDQSLVRAFEPIALSIR